MIVEYEGGKYFAGTLAKYESEFGGRMMGDSKAHEDCKLRILIALHRIRFDTYQLVVGQPISRHNREEKEKIKQMLRGHHSITINERPRSFLIDKVEVAAEGGSAFWSCVQDGLIRIIDIGSGTVM
jgi:plasmid segregation protein ParM